MDFSSFPGWCAQMPGKGKRQTPGNQREFFYFFLSFCHKNNFFITTHLNHCFGHIKDIDISLYQQHENGAKLDIQYWHHNTNTIFLSIPSRRAPIFGVGPPKSIKFDWIDNWNFLLLFSGFYLPCCVHARFCPRHRGLSNSPARTMLITVFHWPGPINLINRKRNSHFSLARNLQFVTECGGNYFLLSLHLFLAFNRRTIGKSREFIVAPRNLLVKLNALEKQTGEIYFENLKKSRVGAKDRHEQFPLENFHGKTRRRGWKCSPSFEQNVCLLVTFRCSLTEFPLRHAAALRDTNINARPAGNSGIFSSTRISPASSDVTRHCCETCGGILNFHCTTDICTPHVSQNMWMSPLSPVANCTYSCKFNAIKSNFSPIIVLC